MPTISDKLLSFIDHLTYTINSAAQVADSLSGTGYERHFEDFEKECKKLYSKISNDIYSLLTETTPQTYNINKIITQIKSAMLTINLRYNFIETGEETRNIEEYVTQHAPIKHRSARTVLRGLKTFKERYKQLKSKSNSLLSGRISLVRTFLGRFA